MDRNTSSVAVGSITVAGTTVVLFLLTTFIDPEQIQSAVYAITGQWYHGNPLSQVRILGAIPGTILTGYLVQNQFGYNDKATAMKGGLYAALIGLSVVYLAYVTYITIRMIVVSGQFPPPLYVILTIPFVFAIGILPVYVLSGVIGGIFGNYLSRRFEGHNKNANQ